MMSYLLIFIFSLISCEIFIRFRLLFEFKSLFIRQKDLFSVLFSKILSDEEKEAKIYKLSISLFLSGLKCFLHLFLFISIFYALSIVSDTFISSILHPLGLILSILTFFLYIKIRKFFND